VNYFHCYRLAPLATQLHTRTVIKCRTAEVV